MNYWIIKSEPHKYAWEKFLIDGRTHWDGVRNYQARNNLQAMREGDLALFYHSNEGKEIVGVAKVVREAYPDTSSTEPQWVMVDFAPVETLPKPVTLAAIKANPDLQNIGLLRQSRLSVIALKPEEFDKLLLMAHTD
ncbi:Predicted RNA-binding protein, contains PUA-like domain [Flexibacter flexilis DSM 6793]|uniref:Predicted RNA-binding protein, contains PUA-like domain n=1 Tax=Flexibacter flexilis DSM 6793 TaxID=927664 RepID=A0A1I1N2C1_9BACT|nr:EVE domain-containing protein [Flexibacter flexilis]SFC91332.1 Predicted RNA-binding protein, contains PUA-like domain [Flexibacter flexilis DSM 6793]